MTQLTDRETELGEAKEALCCPLGTAVNVVFSLFIRFFPPFRKGKLWLCRSTRHALLRILLLTHCMLAQR